MTTNTHTTNEPTIGRRPKTRSLITAAVLSATLAGTGTLAVMTGGVSASGHATSAVPTPAALTEFMDAKGLTGLSPASVAPIEDPTYARTMDKIAAWARANNMKGLSPVSMTPIDE